MTNSSDDAAREADLDALEAVRASMPLAELLGIRLCCKNREA